MTTHFLLYRARCADCGWVSPEHPNPHNLAVLHHLRHWRTAYRVAAWVDAHRPRRAA